MSTPRPYQCLSCRLKTLSLHPSARRSFHTSLSRARKSPYPSIKASDLEQPPHPSAPYTAQERQVLAAKYTPEQMRVIDLGEEAIGADEVSSGKMRTDPARIKYLDDFASMRPGLDRTVEKSDFKLSRGAVDEDEEEKAQPFEMDPHTARLLQQMRISRDVMRHFRVKPLVTHRVVNQTRMGKIASIYHLYMAGNENGLLGIGEGKAVESEEARRHAMMNALRNMRPIVRYEQRTIYGDVQAKVSGTVVQLMARPPGTSTYPTSEGFLCENVLC